MKTLLAVINDLVNSDKFIRYNVSMAEDLGYNLYLVYIQNPALYTLSTGTAASSSQPIDNEVDVTRLETERENALESIKEKLNKLGNDLSENISIDVSAETGTINMVVNEYISDNKAEMAVLKGQDENDFWLVDSPNIDVVQKINCPGWIIPSESNYQPFKKIIYATDYNEADIQTIKRLIALTKQFSPEITALHISDSEDFKEKTLQSGFMDMMKKNTDYDKIFIESITNKEEDDLGECINKYATAKKADLVVLLKENKGFIDKIFKSSSTKKVAKKAIKKAKTPVLIYRE